MGINSPEDDRLVQLSIWAVAGLATCGLIALIALALLLWH